MTKQALVNQQYNLVIPITMYSTSVSESHQNNKMIRTILFIHRNDSTELSQMYDNMMLQNITYKLLLQFPGCNS